MSIGAELGQYILQTHTSKNSEDSMGVEPPNSPSGYAMRDRHRYCILYPKCTFQLSHTRPDVIWAIIIFTLYSIYHHYSCRVAVGVGKAAPVATSKEVPKLRSYCTSCYTILKWQVPAVPVL